MLGTQSAKRFIIGPGTLHVLFSKSQFYKLFLHPAPMLIKWGQSSVSSEHVNQMGIFVSRTCLIHPL